MTTENWPDRRLYPRNRAPSVPALVDARPVVLADWSFGGISICADPEGYRVGQSVSVSLLRRDRRRWAALPAVVRWVGPTRVGLALADRAAGFSTMVELLEQGLEQAEGRDGRPDQAAAA